MVKLKDTSTHIYHYAAKPEIFDLAQKLRKQTTKAEEKLWKHVRNRKLQGLKFRRQHPVNRFVVDFYCHEKLLVVEVDGEIHDRFEVKEWDKGREEELKNLGLTIIRFTNEEVLNDIGSVLSKLKSAITVLSPNLPNARDRHSPMWGRERKLKGFEEKAKHFV